MLSAIRNLWQGRRPFVARPQYTFYGQFSPPQDQVLFETYFPAGGYGVFLECGAFDGQSESSCKFFEESLGWTGVNVEACPVIFERLEVNRPHSTNYCVALSDHDGEATFSLAVHPTFGRQCTNGSLKHTSAHKEQLIEMGCQFEPYPVKLVTYRTLLEMSKISRLDLFVLDVEGHELPVIDGMQGAAVLPRVLCVEHGWNEEILLDAKLATLGFRRDRCVHNNIVYLHDSY